MFRKIFTPNKQNNSIPFVIPSEWYGQMVEVIVFPVRDTIGRGKPDFKRNDKRQSREELNQILDEYPLDLSNFKFNRDEANNYEYNCIGYQYSDLQS